MEWISAKKKLPEHGQKVRYRMKKKISFFKSILVQDCGIFLNGEFCTIAPSYILPIVDWQPLTN